MLGGLAIICLAYKYTYQHWSGYLIVDFMASLKKPMSSFNMLYFRLPYMVYFLTLILMILPTTFKLYFKSKRKL